MRQVIETLADADSVLELTGGFGAGMVTALARIEGKPIGIIANDPTHLGGAIDGEAADKASRFMALCSTFGIPLVFLCDTPGFMVGPEAEETGAGETRRKTLHHRRVAAGSVLHNRAAQGLRARRAVDGRR